MALLASAASRLPFSTLTSSSAPCMVKPPVLSYQCASRGQLCSLGGSRPCYLACSLKPLQLLVALPPLSLECVLRGLFAAPQVPLLILHPSVHRFLTHSNIGYPDCD